MHDELARRPERTFPVSRPARRLRVLFASTGFPWPTVGGGHSRVLSQLQVISSLPEVERVRFFSLHEDAVLPEHVERLTREIPKLEALEPVFHPIHLFAHRAYLPRVAWLRAVRRLPYCAGKWDAPAVRRALQRELSRDRTDVVWFAGVGIAGRYVDEVRRLQPSARVVLDQIDVESDKFAHFAARQRGVMRLIAEAEWRAARKFESETLRSVDAVGAISTEDARRCSDLGGIDAFAVPQVVPFLRRTPVSSPGPRFCYVGNLRWHANLRGLDWFCTKVWPHVRALLSDATLEIAGDGLPTDASGPVMPLAWRVPGVSALGYVPDLAPLLESCAAMVAPVLDATGVRMRLFEAFRHGIPVVTTPQGASGLPIEPGREADIEDEPRAFAARVAEIASSLARQAELREHGYRFLERYHGLTAAQSAIRSLLGISAATPTSLAASACKPLRYGTATIAM